jgi:hypothetical protein
MLSFGVDLLMIAPAKPFPEDCQYSVIKAVMWITNLHQDELRYHQQSGKPRSFQYPVQSSGTGLLW